MNDLIPQSFERRRRTDHQEEVYRLHMTYLIAAKEAMIEKGAAYAAIVYGLHNPLMSWLHTASATQIERLARSKQMVFASRIPGGEAGERMLASAGTDDDALLARLYAVQLMATGGDDGDIEI
jgi:hypothetical protein